MRSFIRMSWSILSGPVRLNLERKSRCEPSTSSPMLLTMSCSFLSSAMATLSLVHFSRWSVSISVPLNFNCEVSSLSQRSDMPLLLFLRLCLTRKNPPRNNGGTTMKNKGPKTIRNAHPPTTASMVFIASGTSEKIPLEGPLLKRGGSKSKRLRL